MTAQRPSLLCISQSYAPATTPTAIRAGKLLDRLAERWSIDVLTEADGPAERGAVRVRTVRARRPRRLLALLRRLRLDKLLELVLWPDDSIFWLPAAIRAGRRTIAERRPAAIVVFMMPYSSGLAGIVLSRLARLPLVLNLDDSPTCTDMHPRFPSRLHYRMARSLEDAYARHADALVYVSKTNLEAARSRQPPALRRKYHLVRYGADAAPAAAGRSPAGARDRFEIAYVGAMSGWWALAEGDRPAGVGERLYAAWTRLGRYERVRLDQRTSSPAIVGRAVLEAVRREPAWAGRIGVAVYGNPYPEELVARALERAGVETVTRVYGPLPHAQIAEVLARADLLFLALPKRVDGSRGGRISAKTYEYLATDRPILAAVPRGENRDYLADKPGVCLVEPDDCDAMSEAIADLARAKFAGAARRFDRGSLAAELSYEGRARQFDGVVREAIEARSRRRRAARGRR